MSEEVEFGVVKFFDNRRDKRFGFLILRGGEELFFHFHAGTEAIVETGVVTFASKVTRPYLKIRDPEPGNRLVFSREIGPGGRVRVGQWAYESNWAAAQNKVNQPWDAAGRKLTQHRELTG